MAISVTMNPSCLSISSPSDSLEHRRRNRKQSELSEDSGSSGGGGRSSRKNKPKTAGSAAGGTKKLPQRGLGVAQLEKLRIQEQQRQQQQNLSSYAAATIPFLNSRSSWAGAAAPGLGFSMSSFMESGSELLVPPAPMRTFPDDPPNMKSCITAAASFAGTHNCAASATAIATASASASTWRKSQNRLVVSLSSAPIFIRPDLQEVPRQAAGSTSKELSSFQNVVCGGQSDSNFVTASVVKKKRSRDFEEEEDDDDDDSSAEAALCQQFFPLTTAAVPRKLSQSVSDHENPYSRPHNSSGKGHGLGLKRDRKEDDDGLLALRLSAHYQRSQCHRQLQLWQQQETPFHHKGTTASCIRSNLHVSAKDDKEKGKAPAMEASKSKRSLSQPHANANAMFLRSSLPSAAASDSRLYSANTHSGRDHEDDLQLSLSLGLSL